MHQQFTCEQCQERLVEFSEGDTAVPRQAISEHLDQCDLCHQQLQSLWEMQALASRWQEESVPRWQRRQLTAPADSAISVPWVLQWVSSFASVAVLVLVLGQAEWLPGGGLKFGGEAPQFSKTELQAAIDAVRLEQARLVDNRIDNLTDQQRAANQLLLRTTLDLSRQERRADFGTLLSAWDGAQDQRTARTEESIRVLLASQVEDRRNIEQINRLLAQASMEGSRL